MKGLMVWVSVLAVAILLAVTACGGEATPAPAPAPTATAAPAAAPAKTYEFQFAHFATPEDGPRWQMALRWSELVEEETGGQVKIEVFPANQLVKVSETVTALGQGALDGAFHPDAYLVGIEPASEWGLMPGLTSPQDYYDIYYDLGLLDLLNSTYMENGIYSSGFYSPGSVDIVVHSKKHVMTPDDLKGKKMRMWGGTWAQVFKEIGTGLVTMPSAEAYIAMQRGTVEGAGSAMAAAYGLKWMEVAPYWSYFAEGGLGGPYSVHALFSQRAWGSLSSNLQQGVLSASHKLIPLAAKARADWDAGLVDLATSEGADIKVPDPKPWVEQVGPLAKRLYLERGGDMAGKIWADVEAWHQKTGR